MVYNDIIVDKAMTEISSGRVFISEKYRSVRDIVKIPVNALYQLMR